MTSPDPSASEGTLGTLPMPILRACATVLAMPTSSSIRTAARLLDVRSAVLTVISERNGMLVLGHPRALQRLDRLVEARHQRRRRIAGLESGGVDKRLEGRSRLSIACVARLNRLALKSRPPTIARTSPVVGSIATSAASSARRSGRSSALAAARFDLLYRRFDVRLGRALHLRIDRGVDLEAAFGQPLPAKLLHELLPHFFLEVLAERLFAAQDVSTSATFSFDARSNAASVMIPCSRIAFSTSPRRATARGMLTVGALTDGALTRPASSAASARSSSDGRFPEVAAGGGFGPVRPSPKYTLFR